MRSMKRVLSLLLVLAMVIAMVPSFAMAAEPTKAAGFTPVGGSETVYYVDTTLQQADTATNTYPSTFDAIEAAYVAWEAVRAGTIDIYQSISFAETLRGPAWANGIFNLLNNDVMTLDLNGNTVGVAEGCAAWNNSGNPGLFTLNNNSSLTINNGNITHTGSRSAFLVGSTTDQSYTGDIVFNNVNYTYSGASAMFAYNGNAGSITLNGGTYDVGASYLYLVNGPDPANAAKPGNAGSSATVTFTGGVVWKANKPYVVCVGTNGRVYLEDAVISTSRNDAVSDVSKGYNIARVATSATAAASSITNVPMTLGNAQGGVSELVGEVVKGTYAGADTYTKTIKPVAVVPTGTKAAGFTAVGGTEVEYKYNTQLTADDTTNNIYTTAEKALAAALTAWDAAGNGTVNVYTDVAVSDTSLFPGADKSALVNVGKDESLTLTFANDVDVMDAVKTYVAFAEDNAVLTVNGGNFAWTNAHAFVTSNSTDKNFTGTLTFNDVNATMGTNVDSGAASFVQNCGLGGDIIFNGGKIVVYNVKPTGNAVSGSGMIVNLVKEAHESTTAVHLRGGVELWNYQFVNIRVGQNAKVYAENVISHANANSAESSIRDDQDGCWGIAGYYTSTGSTAYTGKNVVLGSKDGSVEAAVSFDSLNRPVMLGLENRTDKAYKATNVTVKPVVNEFKAAGFTPVNGTETVYNVNLKATADDAANKTYTTAEKAFVAALTAWKAEGKGTVNLYADVIATNRSLYPNGDSQAGMVNVGKNEELTLNISDGVKITHAAKVYNSANEEKVLYFTNIDSNGKLTINGGTFTWSLTQVANISNSSDKLFTGSLTFNNVKATVSNGKHFVVNNGLAGTVTFNGGEIVAYNVKTTDGVAAISGSGLVASMGSKSVDSATEYVLTGGTKLTSMQYYALRVGQNSKVYAEDCVITAMYQSSGAAGGEGKQYIAAAVNDAGSGADYSLKPLVLGSKSDATKVSDIVIKTQDGTFTAPGSTASKDKTTITVTPKSDNEASYTSGSTTTEYATLDEAFTAMKAAPGGTVKLLKDIDYTVVSGQGHSSSGAYAFDSNAESYTFDFNGHTLKTTAGGFRINKAATVKFISSAAKKGTLIVALGQTTGRNAISLENAGGKLEMKNVAVYANGSVLRVVNTSTQAHSFENVVLYTVGVPLNSNGSELILTDSVIASSTANGISAGKVTVDDKTVVYCAAGKAAHNSGATVTTDPAGMKAATTSGETFKASDYFTGVADATGLLKTVWQKEQMPAGTVATFTGADGVRHIYGIKETSGVFELTVDGVVDATTYAASYTDKTRAIGFAMGLAMLAAKENDCKGAVTLYTDVTLNNGNNGENGGVYKTNGGTSSAIMSLPTDADFVLNLNDHTLTLADLDNKASLMKLSYVNSNSNFTVNGGMAGVEGTDSNGNKIVGGGTGKLVSNTAIFWCYAGGNDTTFNGVDIAAVNAVQLRNAKRTGTLNFNGGSFVGTTITDVQTGSSHTGSTYTINVDKGFVGDVGSKTVYAFRLGLDTESLNIYDATLITNVSTAVVSNYALENYVVRFGTSGSYKGVNQPVRWNAANNVTHTVAEDSANNNIIHTFTRGNPVATYQTDANATAVTCYTWAEAKTAAKAGGIVTLLQDVDYTSVNDYFLDIAVAKDLTLDLNGYTMRAAKGIVAYNFSNKNTNTETVDCVLKIKNGTIITDAVSVNQKRGIMQLDGVKILQTTANNPTVELGTQVENSDIKIDVPATGEGSYIRNSEIYANTNWHAVILSNAGAGNKPHLTVENSIIATADDNNKGYAIGVRHKSHYTGLIVDLKGANEFYTHSSVTALAPSANITFTGMTLSAMKSGQTYEFSGLTGYTGTNLNKWETTFTGGFTYTNSAGETTWYAELGANTGMNKDNGTTDSAYEALIEDPNNGGIITFYESVFYGDKAKYGDTEEVTLADGTKEMAKVDSTFVDKNVSNGYIFSSTKSYTIDMNGHGMFMCDEAISTPNYTAVIIGLQSNNKTSSVEMKDGTIVWAGKKRPFCTGTSSAKDSSYTLTMTDIFYESLGVNGADGNEAFYVQDKSTVILDGGCYKDNGVSGENDTDGIVRLTNNSVGATLILKNGVELHTSRNYAISTHGTNDVVKIESEEGAIIYQAKKGTSANDLISDTTKGSIDIGTLTFVAPKEAAAPYKHEVKTVREVAYYFAPGVDTNDMTKGTGYTTLEEAIAATQAAEATAGGTVKLIKDISYSGSEDMISLDSDSKTFTLDLNGFTVTGEFASREDNFISLGGTASFTLKNGTVNWVGGYKNSSGSAVGVNVISSVTGWSGNLLVEDVHLTNHCAGKVIAVYGPATVTVSGGSLTSVNAPITIGKPGDNAVGNAVVNLKDGVTFYGGSASSGAETSAIRVSTSIVEANKPVINIEDANFYSKNTEPGKIVEVDGTANNYTVNLPTGAEFFVSSAASEYKFMYVSTTGTTLNEKTVTDVYLQSVGVAAVEYTDPTGVTTKYGDLYSAVKAMEAYRSTQSNKNINTQLGTIKLINDIEIDANTPMGTYGFFTNVGGTLVFDMNGHKIETAEGYKMSKQFAILTVNDCNLTIKNGTFNIVTTADFMNIGNSTPSQCPEANVVFQNVHMNVSGGGDIIYSRSSDASVTFDGGHYYVDSATSAKSFIIRTDKNNDGKTTLQVYIKGGAVLEQGGYHGYILSWNDVTKKQMHIYSGAISSYGGYIYSSSQLEATATLYDADGNVVEVAGTGDTFKSNFMKFFKGKTTTPSIYTDGTYTGSYNLFTYNMEPGTADQQADSVAKSAVTGLFYNVDDLLNYMKWMTKADTITAVADIDLTKASASIAGSDAELTPKQDVTFELGAYGITGNVAGEGAVTVNGGSVAGMVSAGDAVVLNSTTINSDLACPNGITANDTVINGNVSVTAGTMALTGTTINGELSVTAAGNHTVSGGAVNTSAAVEVGTGAIITVSDNAVIDASNSAALTGNGAVIFKEAVVKFADANNPYGSVTTEGSYTDAAGAVTVRTYTLLGDKDQGSNVALLVENDRYFATVADAIAAASNLTNETVQLVADTTENILVDKGVAIDLNGFSVIGDITVNTNGTAQIANGTVATTAATAVTVVNGNAEISKATIAATGSAVVVNGANAAMTLSDSTVTGDSDCTDDGYALDVQAASDVFVDNSKLFTGAENKAAVAVGANVAYEVVTVNSGEIYIPKAYYEATRLWAEGQEKITCPVNSVSRYSYDNTIENPADGSTARKSFYLATATAPAAMIGKVGYATLREAIAAANNMNGAEIVLMRDIELTDDYAGLFDPANTASTYLIYLKKAMTIDFNGYSIYGVNSGKYGVFNISSGVTITMKNGTISNMYPESTASGTKSSYTFMNSGNLHMDNMNVYAYNLCLSSAGSTANAKFYINGGTYVSKAHFAAQANSPSGRATNPEFFVTGGARFISMSTSSTYPAGINAQYTAFVIDDAYVYYNASATASNLANALPKDAAHVIVTLPDGATSVEEIGHMATDENGNKIASLLKTYTEDFDGKTFTVNYYGVGNVAKVGTEEFASLDSALTAAAADGKTENVVLLKDITISSDATVAAGESIDLNGYNVSFSGSGKLNLEGNLTTNGGKIESEGNVAIAAGATINGYAFTSAAALNTNLNVSSVSLSLNEYVDINVKYSQADTAAFNGVKVLVDGAEVSMAKTANGLNIYKIENLTAADYTTAKWVVMEGNMGNTASVGLPVQVSVKAYAKAIVNSTKFGYDSDLGMAMTAMMDYAGVDVNAEFAGNSHTDIADFGTAMSTNNGVLAVSADFTKGYALNVTSTAAGTLTVKHTDIYGTEFAQNFTVAAGDTVTYTMIHVADAKQTVTVTLTDNGAEISKLETNLASTASGADKAIVVSNLAEKFFTAN